VSSIARTIGRALRLNEDLIEALALIHDLGHPPFGHAGEATLDACLAADGGFNHNRHALRIVEHLETRCREFPGLNLSLEVLAGQQARIDKRTQLQRPPLEVQVVDAADSIAYDAHDADDALELDLLSLDELVQTPLWREAARRVQSRYSDVGGTGGADPPVSVSGGELRRAVVHELIDWQVDDLLEQSDRRLSEWRIDDPSAVLAAPWVVAPSPELAEQKAGLESLLQQRVYRHEKLLAMRKDAQDALNQMFAIYLGTPDLLPDRFRARIPESGLARSVGDYLAGMTDRYALSQHRRLLSV
jgi:dGTPase